MGIGRIFGLTELGEHKAMIEPLDAAHDMAFYVESVNLLEEDGEIETFVMCAQKDFNYDTGGVLSGETHNFQFVRFSSDEDPILYFLKGI